MPTCRTYPFQLKPTRKQEATLLGLFDRQRELYNAALEARRGSWSWNRRSLTYFDECKELTDLREVRPDTLVNGVVVCRGTLKRLDRAFCAFYRRCQRGQAPGFPRFKAASRWHSVQWEDTSGWKVLEAEKRVRILGIGEIRVHQRTGRNRPMRGVPKAATLRREGNRWWLDVRCAEVPDQPLAPTGCEVGVDVGVSSLVATSDGWLYTNPKYFQQAQDKLARAQQELATKKPGTQARRRTAARVRRLHRKVASQRKDLAHKISKDLVEGYDLIVVEDLKIQHMVRRAKPRKADDGTYLPNGAAAKRGLNRSIHDAGWALLTAMLIYKAESAGRCLLAVSPAHTSQRCVRYGHTAKENRCSQATFRCRACGHCDHADVNAARNILRAGQALLASAGEGSK